MSNMIGQLIDKRYRIERAIGFGGMATVYLAEDESFIRDVAVKIMNDPADLYEGFGVEKFRQEAKLVASLEHHAIVPVYDFGEHENRPFLVMRLMQGGTLKERLALGQLTLDGIGSILERICSALDKAHMNHVVHRDIKPGNILFDEEGMPYLADFGIARLTNKTQTVSLIGSPRYMAPEQAKSEKLSAQTDVYQMAVVLFHMLTGRVPFDGDTTESVLYQHVYQPIPLLKQIAPRLPIALEDVLQTALAKHPEERYPTAGALSRAYQSAIGRQTAQPVPIPQPRPEPTINYEQSYETATLPPTQVEQSVETVMPAPPAAVTYEPPMAPVYEPVSEPQPTTGGRRPWVWITILSVFGIGLFVCGAVIFAFNNPELFGFGDPNPSDPVVLVPTQATEAIPTEGAEPTDPAEDDLAPTVTLPGEDAEEFLLVPADTLANLGGGPGIIAYAANLSEDDPNAFDLFVTDENGSTRQITDHEDADFRPVWSPDGSKIAYHSLNDTWDIYIMDPDGTNKQRITTDPRDDSFPSWSPDSSQIAFHSNRFQVQFDIYVSDIATGEVTRLTETNLNELAPAFSPDGTQIAFHRQMADGTRQIFVMDADGTNEVQLTDADNFSEYPSWSPDGSQITFFSTRDGAAQVYTMAADGSNVTQITNSTLGAFYPAFTPNGEWIIFHTITEGSNRDLFIVRVNGSESIRLTDSAEQERLPAWRP